SQQAYLVQVNHLFKGLHKAKTQKTAALLNLFAIYFDVLGGIGNVALAWADPMTNNAGAQHIADKVITLPVPDPKHWTRAATAVNFFNTWSAVGGNLSFVLDDTAGPKRAHHIDPPLFSQANQEVGRALAEISRPTNLPLLPESPGK